MTAPTGRRDTRRMLIDLWPLHGLRLVTPRLELRYPNEEEEPAAGLGRPAMRTN